MALRELTDGALPEVMYARLFVYGETGAGKSTFGSTMPGPRAILAADDNASIPLKRDFAELPRSFTPEGEQHRRPAWLLTPENWQDIDQAIGRIELEHKKRDIKTIVVDDMTKIAEMCARQVLVERNQSLSRARGGSTRTLESLDQQGYGLLFERLDTFRHRLNMLPCHIAYLCSGRGPKAAVDDNDPAESRLGGPDIRGQQAKRFPSSCQAVLFVEQTVTNGKRVVRVHTSNYNGWTAKDNTGRLDPIEPPDAYPILAKMGYLNADLSKAVLAKCPPMTAEARAAAAGGVVFG